MSLSDASNFQNTEQVTEQKVPEAVFPPVGPLERTNLVLVLEQLSQRLSSVEAALTKKGSTDERKSSTIIECLKVLLGGWPAFGLVVLILFYSPIRAALNAIPDKVRSADEIGVLGVSLKSTIRLEAVKLGALGLSETLPTLTPTAIALLLRTSKFNSLTSFTPGANREVKTVYFPSEQFLTTLDELERKGLVRAGIMNNSSTPNGGVEAIRKTVREFCQTHPGRELEQEEGRISWELKEPIQPPVPNFTWELTELGRKGVDIILKAISAQLSPKEKNEANTI